MAEVFDAAFIIKCEQEIQKLVVDRMNKISIAAYGFLVSQNPVDTGQSRAGWNFTLNKIDKSAPRKPKSGTLARKPPVPDNWADRIGDSYFIVNAVEHTIYLNEGHSEQAPSNFIENSLIKAVKRAEELK